MHNKEKTSLPKIIEKTCGKQTYEAIVRAQQLSDTERYQAAWKALLAERIYNTLWVQGRIPLADVVKKEPDFENRVLSVEFVSYWLGFKEAQWRKLTTKSGCYACMIAYISKTDNGSKNWR
jgi:hypothetical protein